jgi:putative ABC transport system permease protein
MREWIARVVAMFRKRSLQERLARELALHRELLAEDLANAGSSSTPERELGRASFQDEYYDRAGIPLLENLWADIRYACRTMRRAPSFAAMITVTLALGIGLTTAIFTVVHGVLLEPLPYPDGDRLVWLGESTGSANGISVTAGNFSRWRSDNRSFDARAAFQFTGMTMTGRSEAMQTTGLQVTPEYLALLGVRPLLGRLLVSDDERPGASAVIVLTHRFWSATLGGDPQAIGNVLTLDGKPYEIVGVAAPVWEARPVDYYMPLAVTASMGSDRSRHGSMRALGRLKSGVTLATARADLDGVMRRLAETDPGPENEHRSFGQFLTERITGEARQTLIVLMGAALLVLLIACANVASLLLARGTTRSSEFAVRTAIGAGRDRLVRQLLTENLVLATAGGLAGVALAYAACHALVSQGPIGIPRLTQIELDRTVLLFAFAMTIATGIVAGIAPALAANRLDVNTALKDGTRSVGQGRHRQSTRSALVVAEIALTLVLMFGSGLLVRSLIAAQKADPGVNARQVLSLHLLLSRSTYGSPQAIAAFYDGLLTDLRGLPGVSAATAVRCPPGAGDCNDWFYSIAGRPAPPRDDVPIALFNVVDQGYFRALEVPLIEGREFYETDRANSVRVAVVNETLARRWWPRASAVGRQIKVGGPYVDGPLLDIVGVAGDVRQGGLDSPPLPEIYQPLSQSPSAALAILLRASGDPEPLIPPLRRRVAAHDRNLPIQSLQLLERTLESSLARRRFTTFLLACFAGLAIVLAGVGIYGLLSYWVNVREREIAIRLALGACPALILRWTGSQALRLAVLGVAFGALGGWMGARVLDDLVFGLPARSPATLIAAAIVVTAIAAFAAAVPAWRAARVDPAQQLQR